MRILRYLAILALAAWVGGLLALGGTAAPSLFAVLEARDPAAGRQLAGLLFGAIFDRFQLIALGLGVVTLASLGARAALGPRPRRFAVRMWAVTFMLGITAATVWGIAPRIAAIRDSVSTPVASLPADDARRVTFGRLHGASSALLVLTVLMGAGLLWAESTDAH